LNQQQLQTARTALWRQDGHPLLTTDDAAAWLEEMGICLFLPRHAQLPAPAPSFVEACAGVARAVPAPAAIDAAMALATRLVAEGRAVPLSLMGNLTEQPDFLTSPEALRWAAAVRGDRNWKAAPGGRTAPLVQRVWEALDRAPGRTEPEIRGELGRELTEAAVLRALVELWTTMRAAPEYAPGEATRWSLMRDRSPREMAAGANTAQTTALSALISLYLRQAVAATSEEAEIFLSPLTARSRIREVLHGMLATRQFGTMPLGVQTLLYLEGTLPEAAEEEVAAPAAETPAAMRAESDKDRDRLKRAVVWEPRRESRPERRSEPRSEFRCEPQRTFPRGPKRQQRPESGPRREFRDAKKRPYRPSQKPEWRPGAKPGQGQEKRRAFGKPDGKPREKRKEFPGQRTRRRQGGEVGKRREGGFRREHKPGGWPAPRRPEQENRQRGENLPSAPREGRGGEPGGGFGKKLWHAGRPRREQNETRPARGELRRGEGQARQNRSEFRREGRREFRRDNREPGENRGGFRSGNRPERGETRFAARPKFAGKPARPGGSGERPGKRFGKPGVKLGRQGGRLGKPGGKFGKPGRPQENKPRDPRSGKNRKGQEDKPE